MKHYIQNSSFWVLASRIGVNPPTDTLQTEGQLWSAALSFPTSLLSDVFSLRSSPWIDFLWNWFKWTLHYTGRWTKSLLLSPLLTDLAACCLQSQRHSSGWHQWPWEELDVQSVIFTQIFSQPQEFTCQGLHSSGKGEKEFSNLTV